MIKGLLCQGMFLLPVVYPPISHLYLDSSQISKYPSYIPPVFLSFSLFLSLFLPSFFPSFFSFKSHAMYIYICVCIYINYYIYNFVCPSFSFNFICKEAICVNKILISPVAILKLVWVMRPHPGRRNISGGFG